MLSVKISVLFKLSHLFVIVIQNICNSNTRIRNSNTKLHKE